MYKRQTQYLSKLSNEKSENFANGSEMRNLFEKAFTNQANRLSQYNDISDEELNIIQSEDIIDVYKRQQPVQPVEPAAPTPQLAPVVYVARNGSADVYW